MFQAGLKPVYMEEEVHAVRRSHYWALPEHSSLEELCRLELRSFLGGVGYYHEFIEGFTKKFSADLILSMANSVPEPGDKVKR